MKSCKNPLIPMGAVTGDLSREQIRTMLRRYADAGVQQYLMYPRDGCDVSYMSERWLEICGDIIEAAAELGMDIWLYDEFNWPSGTCFGAVMAENPAYAAHCVRVTEDGCTIERTALAPGRIPETYADILNPDAVDCFIRLTHDKYYERFKDYFGTTIKGIFTDEPSFSYYTYSGGYAYFKDAEKFYAERTGRNLFADMMTPTDAFYIDYYALLGDKFREVFVGRIAKWCDEHGILMTGHLLGESTLSSTVRSSGNPIKALRGFTLPAIDEISTNTAVDKAEWLTFGTIQAAARVMKNGALVETFAPGPTDLQPARIEQMLWLEAMFGIDHYVLAVSAVDARGNVKKNGWYNPMCYTNPWFAGYGELGASAARAAEFARREIAAEVYVRIPFSLGAKYQHDKEKSAMMNGRVKLLLETLTKRQLQWLLLDEDEAAPDGVPVIEITDVPDWTVDGSIPEIEPTLHVLNHTGTLADNILLRRFRDGSAVVLDLSDSEQPRELHLCRGGETSDLLLPGRGHYVLGDEPPREYITVCESSPTFRIRLDHPNTLRCSLRSDKREFTFTATERLDGIRMLVRDYMPGGELSIDGITLDVSRPAEALTPGLSELYRSTAPFTLQPGEHTVRITEPAKSEPFLPSCFLCGSFASDGTDRLRAMPKTVGVGRLDIGTLPQYAGCITYETTLELPREPLSLALESSGLYTRVSVNGVSLGGQLGGYVWQLPPHLAGASIALRIEQYTSIAPIFGRAADVIAASDGERWTSLARWFPGKYQRCGIERIRLVK